MTVKDYLILLKQYSQYDFCGYSDNSINRRIQKILSDYSITLEELAEKTKKDKSFVNELVNDVTVNTTEWFRDYDLWIYLHKEIVPHLKHQKNINIWHAGCSTGQEVYSMLILLNELNLVDRVSVIGTDLNERVLKQAQQGIYSTSTVNGMLQNHDKIFRMNDEAFIAKYFDKIKDSDSIQVKEFLRKKTQFKKHDLVNDSSPSFKKFDIIFCRNVIIYFNKELQLKVFQLFYDQLYPGGRLVLGAHEVLNGFHKTKFIKDGPVLLKNQSFHLKVESGDIEY